MGLGTYSRLAAARRLGRKCHRRTASGVSPFLLALTLSLLFLPCGTMPTLAPKAEEGGTSQAAAGAAASLGRRRWLLSSSALCCDAAAVHDQWRAVRRPTAMASVITARMRKQANQTRLQEGGTVPWRVGPR